MHINPTLRPAAAAPPSASSKVMRRAVSVRNGTGAPSRIATAHASRQLVQYAFMLRRDISCTAPAPLHGACHRTASRRQPVSPAHCFLTRACSLSSAGRLPFAQLPGHSCSSHRQLVGRRSLHRPSRQFGSIDNVQPTRLAAAGSSSGGDQSVDDDEEGDAGVTRELEGYEAERFRQVGRHLDLMWNVGKVLIVSIQKPRPAPCDCCEGSGSRSCGYCNSTGAMMVGHERFCSLEQGCKPCPICNGTGEVKCSHCQGTGYRAGWLDPGCPVEQ